MGLGLGGLGFGTGLDNNNNEGGAWRQLGRVPGQDAGLHATSPERAHSLGDREAGAEERGRGQHQQVIQIAFFVLVNWQPTVDVGHVTQVQ